MRFFQTGVVLSLLFACVACGRPMQSLQNDSEVLAKIDGQPVTTSGLSNRHRMSLYQAEMEFYRSRQEVLDKLIGDRLMEVEAKKANLSVAELKKREVEDKAATATPNEINEFYEQRKEMIQQRMKDIPKGQPKPTTAELKEMIGKQLNQRRLQERQQAYMAELRNAHKVEILLKEPQAPAVEVGAGENNPFTGGKDAKVTIVEFSDFQCPYCARAVPSIKEVEKTYGDKVKIVFRDFPLSFHNTAHKQAEAAACAHEQGKFWDYHDKLFANQSKTGAAFGNGNQKALNDTLVEYAKQISIDPAKFKECLESGKMSANIDADIQAGEEAGVNSTPSFFVNGKLLAGALPASEFKKIIDEELKK